MRNLLFIVFFLVSIIEAKTVTTNISGQEVTYTIPDSVEKLKSESGNPFSFKVLLDDPSPLPPDYQPILNRFQFNKLSRETSVNYFQIDYVSSGQTDAFGQMCTTFPEEAKAVFEYAAQIWSSFITTTVPITVRACWASLEGGTLGYSGSFSVANFGEGLSDTYYTYSLANALYGSDLYPSDSDTHITYNSNFSWYYGTDGQTPFDKHDLLSVVLHEMTHSLNFSGTMTYNSGLGYSWAYPYAGIWDRFIVDGSSTPVLNTENNTSTLGSLLISDNLYFNGVKANAANEGSKVKIYAPSTWTPGSSYTHLDYNTFNNTANQLMVYAISAGEAIHDPGDIALGMLEDMGWSINHDACSYTITPLSDSFTESGGSGYFEVQSTPEDCITGSWDATEALDWVTLTGTTEGSGHGNWVVDFNVAPNSGTSRSGSINVEMNTFTIDQVGLVPDDVAIDEATNLMWQDEEYTLEEQNAYIYNTEAGKVMHWDSAISYCNGLELGGHTDWYLPSLGELVSIVDTNNFPTIKSIFQNVVVSEFWTSTPYDIYSSYLVEFLTGSSSYYLNDHSFYTRCVRPNTSPSESMSPAIIMYLLN